MDVMYFGWEDHDKRKPVLEKLLGGVEAFREKFGIAPKLCLTSIEDAAKLSLLNGLPVTVEGRRYISKDVFYVGTAPELGR